MNNQLDFKHIEGEWVLVDAKPIKGNARITGYWEFYGLDILVISNNNTLQTYSFLDDSLVSDFNYAYNSSEKELNIFMAPEAWQSSENTFSVTLKVVTLDQNHLTLLYSIYNAKNQLYGEVMELHYVAIRDFALQSDLLVLIDILSSNDWQTEELTLSLSASNSNNERHYYKTEEGDVDCGLWHLHDISMKKLLVLQKKTGENRLYQIQKISNNYIELINLNTDQAIILKSYP